MKRYLIFAGSWYYPGGGANDFVDSVDTIDEVDELFRNKEFQRGIDWAHAFDYEQQEIGMRWERK